MVCAICVRLVRHWPGQCRGPGDLVGAPFVPEQSLDPADAQRIDARVAVRSLAAGSADPISALRVIARHIGIAAELAADGARRAVQAVGDRPKRKPSLAKGVDSVSFMLIQAACGHGQLHLAVKSLRLGRLNPFSTLGVALRS